MKTMKPEQPQPVKFFCGVLYSDEMLLQRACEHLQAHFGLIDYKSPLFPFQATDYYIPEMGSPIVRCFWAFHDLVNPKILAESKLYCSQVEEALAIAAKRKVNLDPGYMDYDKVVLASAKYNSQKIYLDLGIYADVTLYYERGFYRPSEYAFPDFKSGSYNDVFLNIRAKYKGQLRKMMRQQNPKALN